MESVFPTAYFGSISYYQNLVSHKLSSIEQWETYPKHSSRNHCSILTPNGVLELIVPLFKPNGSKTITKDVKVDYSTDWVKKHWRTLVTSYKSSPYFDHYGIEIEQLLNKKYDFLLDLNLEINDKINSYLELGISCDLTIEFQKNVSNDFRLAFNKPTKESISYDYQQVFVSVNEFYPDLSVLDALFNLGPMARKLFIS